LPVNHLGKSDDENPLQPSINNVWRLLQEAYSILSSINDIISIDDIMIILRFMGRRTELKERHLTNQLSYDDQKLIKNASAVFQKYVDHVRDLQDS
jgi:hypothetical protein